MKIVGYEQPSLEEALEHHGILGMHWGQRKARPPSARQMKDQRIHDSRATVAEKRAEIYRLKNQARRARTPEQRAHDKALAKVKIKDLKNSPEFNYAHHFTSGEKWLLGGILVGHAALKAAPHIIRLAAKTA